MPLSTASPPIPLVLGRWEVGPRVAGGGMANVYVGRSLEGDPEELVALKVMRDEYGRDPKYLRMFSDEAKILARLAHPNVIRTYESGITLEHRYIVMELLAGRPLADVWDLMAARQQRISLRLGAWICARIAEGLHAAHELTDDAGIPLDVIHRDVNPSNLLLTYDGEVKLIDFGLAKARVRRTKSAEGVVKGKIPYLAPEQLTRRPIDRRIDVYALGTTLWELGTMRRLFKRDTDLETLHAIRDGEVPDVRTVVPGFPARLRAIIARALEPDPDARYATAGELQADLDDFLEDDGEDLKSELAVLVSRTFPGEEAKQRSWRRDAIAVPRLSVAPPPPSGIPTASSSMTRTPPQEIVLDDADIEVVK